MSRYLSVRRHGSSAIAICGRCNMKVYHDDLMQDPNNQQWCCHECVDLYDPYRLPARVAEDISLRHPRPDVPLTISSEEVFVSYIELMVA